MSITQLASNTADFNLNAAAATVLSATPHATLPKLCQILVELGNGTKDLDGSGGDFELTIVVGSQVVQPGPQTIAFGTDVRAAVLSAVFAVPANEQLDVKVKSPNAADTDVTATTRLFDLSADATVGDLTAAALAKFATQDTGETTVGSGSVAQLARGVGSGVVTVVASTGSVTSTDLVAYEAAAATFVFTHTAAMTGKTVKLVVFKKDDSDTVQFTSADATIGGVGDVEATIATTATNNETPGCYRYVVRITDDDAVIAEGQYTIRKAGDAS